MVQSLRSQLEEAHATLHETGQECTHVKGVSARLEEEVGRLRAELQRRETALQTAVEEKTAQDHTLQTSQVCMCLSVCLSVCLCEGVYAYINFGSEVSKIDCSMHF